MKKREEMEKYIQRKRQDLKKDAMAQIQKIVSDYDLSYDEVVAAIRTTTKRGKAPAIYRNPDKPRQTWSGKGDAPSWFVSAKDKEALRIPGA